MTNFRHHLLYRRTLELQKLAQDLEPELGTAFHCSIRSLDDAARDLAVAVAASLAVVSSKERHRRLDEARRAAAEIAVMLDSLAPRPASKLRALVSAKLDVVLGQLEDPDAVALAS